MRETQLSGFHAVEKTHGKGEYMPLDLGAELGDEVLRFDAQEKREQVGGTRLNDHGDHQEPQQSEEQVELTLAEYVVDQVLRRGRKHQPAESIEKYQDQAERNELAAGPDDLSKGVSEAVPGDFGRLCQELESREWCESPEDHSGSCQPTDPFSVGREGLDADDCR